MKKLSLIMVVLAAISFLWVSCGKEEIDLTQNSKETIQKSGLTLEEENRVIQAMDVVKLGNVNFNKISFDSSTNKNSTEFENFMVPIYDIDVIVGTILGMRRVNTDNEDYLGLLISDFTALDENTNTGILKHLNDQGQVKGEYTYLNGQLISHEIYEDVKLVADDENCVDNCYGQATSACSGDPECDLMCSWIGWSCQFQIYLACHGACYLSGGGSK